MKSSISESEFYVWRTLFALAHVDHVVSAEELRFMIEVLEDLPFSQEQKDILNQDIKTPQDPRAMFGKISDLEDKIEFFRIAHDMVWVDGVFGKEEQAIMIQIQKEHIRNTDIDELIGKIELRLEGEAGADGPRYMKDAKKIVHSFRQRFLKDFDN